MVVNCRGKFVADTIQHTIPDAGGLSGGHGLLNIGDAFDDQPTPTVPLLKLLIIKYPQAPADDKYTASPKHISSVSLGVGSEADDADATTAHCPYDSYGLTNRSDKILISTLNKIIVFFIN